MAKTFDVSDPDQYEAYLAASMTQMELYGGVHMQFQLGKSITVYDPSDLPDPGHGQLGFRMVMDDGRVLPFPHPAVTP